MLQTKHIPDRPILQFLRAIEKGGVIGWDVQGEELVCTVYSYSTLHSGCPHSIENGINYYLGNVTGLGVGGDSHKRKLVQSKMDSLIRRGLVDGCACGCMGEFTLTDKGRAFLEPVGL